MQSELLLKYEIAIVNIDNLNGLPEYSQLRKIFILDILIVSFDKFRFWNFGNKTEIITLKEGQVVGRKYCRN